MLTLPLVSLSLAFVQPPAPDAPKGSPLDWKILEAPLLANHTQLTSRDKFMKAGESYFSPDGQWIIFQATEVPETGKEPDPFYAMYITKFSQGMAIGTTRVSPPGSANTCGWFSPTSTSVIFGSTLTTPKDEGPSGYQRGSSRYRWAFPAEMEVVQATYDIHVQVKDGPAIEQGKGPSPIISTRSKIGDATKIFSRPNYDAECSYDKSGRFILYAHIEDAKEGQKPDANIYIFDTKTQKHHPIIVAPGYDGGPFFSPDGKMICYRSDRKGNDLLQIFVATLKFEKDADGTDIPVGVVQEYQLTDNEHVNWCPYWHPSGKFLVYATSEVSHANYEVFAIEVDQKALVRSFAAQSLLSNHAPFTCVVRGLRKRRVTHADGADVLPVFSFDGKYMMWTCQRGPKAEGEPKPSSQLWIAEWKGGDNPFDK